MVDNPAWGSAISLNPPQSTPKKLSGIDEYCIDRDSSPSSLPHDLSRTPFPAELEHPRSYSSLQVYNVSETSTPREGLFIKTRGRSSSVSGTSAVLIAGALQAEVKQGRNQAMMDMYLTKAQNLAVQSDKQAGKLIAAGVVPTIVDLLKTRAGTVEGLEVVLTTLGVLA